MAYELKWYENQFLNKLQEEFSKYNGTLNDLKSFANILEKTRLYFENEAFFDEWKLYDPNLPNSFSPEDIKILKLCPGWRYWEPNRQSVREKLEKIAGEDPKELYLAALDGNVEAGCKMFGLHLSNNGNIVRISNLEEVFLKRKTLLQILNYFRTKAYPETILSRWASAFRVTSPILEDDNDTHHVLIRLQELGDEIDGTIEDDELEEMIALMSLPDETDPDNPQENVS